MTDGHRQRAAELRVIFAGREEIVDIGQVTDRDRLRLEWGVRHGLVLKTRRPWPGPVVGTCIKTVYVRLGGV